MDTKSIVTPLVTTVVAFIALWGLLGGGPAGKDGKDGSVFGGTNPDIISNYLRWGDTASYKQQAVLSNASAATNTPCILTSPAATSTLVFAQLSLSTGSTTATGWFASKGTGTGEATTTANQLGSYAIGSATLGTMTLRPALSTVDPVSVFAPNSKLVWTISGTAIANTANFNGTCNAEWITVR